MRGSAAGMENMMRALSIALLGSLAVSGCAYTRCEFTGVTPREVGAAVGHVGCYAIDRIFIVKSYKKVWSKQFTEQLAEGRGGRTEWSVSEASFFAFSKNSDDIRLSRTEQGNCLLEIRCEKREMAIPFFLPPPGADRNEDRERAIVQHAYWRLKQTRPEVTAKAKGEWQPAEKPPATQPN